MYDLLIVVSIVCLFSYIGQSLFADIQVNHTYPEKFLVKNKFILRYFLNPKAPITKHYTIFHFTILFYFVLVLVMYAIYWITGSNPILENPQFREYNLISLGIFTAIFYIIVIIIERKYQKL